MMGRYVTDVSVEGIEKRRSPSKHYVYVLYVTWSDGAVNVLYRRYSLFYQLQTHLLDNYPVEAGFANPADRILPFLPGKILFGRSKVQRVALKRLQPIDEYCKALLSLPSKITRSPTVLDFFKPTHEDVLTTAKQEDVDDVQVGSVGSQVSAPRFLEQFVAVTDYFAEGEDEVSLEANEIIEVVSKHDSGWWLVKSERSQGWVPSTYLEKISGQDEEEPQRLAPGKEEQYIAIEEYIPQYKDEVELQPGALVQVLHKTLDGWWLIRYKGEEGRVPAMHLRKADERKASLALEKLAVGVFEAKSRDKKSNPIDRTRERSQHATNGAIYAKVNVEEKFENLLKNKRKKPLPAPPRKKSIKIKNSQALQAFGNELAGKLNQHFVVKDNFNAKAAGSVRLRKGQRLTVHEQRDSGWWLVETDDQMGWAPASHLVGSSKNESDSQSQSGSNSPSSPASPSSPTFPGFQQAQGSKSEYIESSIPQPYQATPVHNHLTDNDDDDEHDYENVNESSSYENMFTPEIPTTNTVSNTTSVVAQNHNQTKRSRAIEMKGKPVYVARSCYRGAEETETDLESEERVVVVEKAGGWWYVHAKAGDGWVPSHYLRSADSEPTKPSVQPKPTPAQRTHFHSLSNHHYGQTSNTSYNTVNQMHTDYAQPHKGVQRFGLQVMPSSVALNSKNCMKYDDKTRNVKDLRMMFSS